MMLRRAHGSIQGLFLPCPELTNIKRADHNHTVGKEWSRVQKIWIVLAIMLALSLAALDMTIVGTAMPTIISDLHGVALYSWVFSIYLLTSTTPVPVYGKVADMFGRKWTFIFGASLFTIGSWLCGIAQSMPELIIFRGLQGLGAAGVLPIALTIVGDIFTLEQRARVQGFFSAVWGLSAVAGPLIGAYVVEHYSWRWVFDINLPIGALVIAIILLTFHENVKVARHHIDWQGALLLTAGAALLLIGLIQTPWTLPSRISAIIAGLVILGGFVWWEHHSLEPLMPLELFKNRFIGVSYLVNFLAGMVMFSLISYVPMLAQGVWSKTPTGSGLSITPMLLGWPLAAFANTPLVRQTGFRQPARLGGLFLVSGMIIMVLRFPITPASLMAGMLIVGAGLGFTLTSLLLGVQMAVPWNLRGSATSSIQFFRTIGGSMGVAIIGAVFDSALGGKIAAHHLSVTTGQVTTTLLQPALRSHLSFHLRHLYHLIFSHSLYLAFLWMAALAAGAFSIVFLIPAEKAAPAEKRKAS